MFANRREVMDAVQSGKISVSDAFHIFDNLKFQQGQWVPANGGTEKPFKTRNGMRVLYCWHTGTGDHAYLNCDTDIIMTQEEVNRELL